MGSRKPFSWGEFLLAGIRVNIPMDVLVSMSACFPNFDNQARTGPGKENWDTYICAAVVAKNTTKDDFPAVVSDIDPHSGMCDSGVEPAGDHPFVASALVDVCCDHAFVVKPQPIRSTAADASV